jgi:hypothetical protein
LKKSSVFKIVAFDTLAAVEYAATRQLRKNGVVAKTTSTRAKAKFDDQIVAIAAVERATIIYSDDSDIRKIVGDRFEVLGISDLPLPPESAQFDLNV